MRKSKYNSFDELPLMLTVEDVSHVLGIGLAHAYEVAHRKDFPTITLGSRTVSYTHLDVYKRKWWDSGGRTGRSRCRPPKR